MAAVSRPVGGTPLGLRAFDYWRTAALKTWRISFFVNVVTPVLFLAALGVGLGSLVDRRGGVQGGSYLDFLAPALLAATVFQSAVTEATYPVMASVRWLRTYEAMLATPLGVGHVMRGHLGFIVARTALVGTSFLAAMAAFGAVDSWWGLLCIPIVVLLTAAAALPTAAFSVSLKQEVWFAVLFRLIVVPLFLFSGTFAPLSTLPGWVAVIAKATPLWHAVELCRSATHGSFAAASWVHLAYLLTMAGLGYLWVSRAYRRALSA